MKSKAVQFIIIMLIIIAVVFNLISIDYKAGFFHVINRPFHMGLLASLCVFLLFLILMKIQANKK